VDNQHRKEKPNVVGVIDERTKYQENGQYSAEDAGRGEVAEVFLDSPVAPMMIGDVGPQRRHN